MIRRLRRAVPVLFAVAVVVAACGGGADGAVDPNGSFGGVDGAASPAGDGSGAGDGDDGDARDASGADGDGYSDGAGAGSTTTTAAGPAGDGGGSVPVATPDVATGGGTDVDAALAVWDEFLVRWEGLRNGTVARDELAEVAVIDEGIAEVVDGSVEADAERATATVELHGGTRGEIVVDEATVTFVDCVYEKALGPLPWVLAQRWEVTVSFGAGPDDGAAVTGLTQRASVAEDGEVIFDVCLNPVLEQEVVAAHIALREMFVETQENPVVGIDDPRIDELLMPANAGEFRDQLQVRIDEGTRLVNALGTNLRVQVFGHGPNFVGTISCEDQQDGYSRVDTAGEASWLASDGLQSLSSYRLVLTSGAWQAEQTQVGDDFECPALPLGSVSVSRGDAVPIP